ncbi:hypothetical protein ES319_D10G188800v1 [Gossypium barbadense]|uniref:Uncharacterized protein n=3 Tax=Gossypium TaxID=3633 RepID=A0A5J5PUW5_GOSBA|nr:hypothetical protein ES319_D10G188800v1 [Gossypium barbadense]KAB2009763.1 hypothetical protein ES319_D10G188800v1 [Gossypium barbadense]TYG50789.1 hypothetical protein ES288_D10G203900v1 [Gossypium darwinii]TYH50441.1 hypothetical protein ES332_D10G206200v1 [Gossypium tomentosum]
MLDQRLAYNRTGEARTNISNASPSTSTRKNPYSAPNRIAWTYTSASTVNTIGDIQFLALSIHQLQKSSFEIHVLLFHYYFCILGRSLNLVFCIETY